MANLEQELKLIWHNVVLMENNLEEYQHVHHVEVESLDSTESKELMHAQVICRILILFIVELDLILMKLRDLIGNNLEIEKES